MAVLVMAGLRDLRRTTIAWALPLGFFSAGVVALYPSISDSLQSAVRGYPEELREAFGVGQLNTVEAYLHAEMFSFMVPLALGLFAARAAIRPLSGAEEAGHLDVLLAVPVPRWLLALSALLTAAAAAALVLALVWLLTLGASAATGSHLSAGQAGEAVLAVWALSLLYAALAIAVCGIRRGAGFATGVVGAALGAAYLVDVLAKVADPIEPLRWVSPFHYAGAPLVDGLDVGELTVLLTASAVLALAGLLFFQRRDLMGR